MITKLPIILDYKNQNGLKSFDKSCKKGKLLHHNFKITKSKNKIILDVINSYNTLKFIHIPCINNYNCIYYLNVSLPLEITIIGNNLVSIYFFILAVNSINNSELDFFTCLCNYINTKLNKKYKLLSYDNIKKYQKKIFNYFNIKNKEYNLEKYKNTDEFLSYFYKRTLLYFNFGLCINYLYPEYTNKSIKHESIYDLLNKKLLNVTNSIKNYNFSYKVSSKYTISQHIINFNKNIVTNIKNNNIYYLNINKTKSVKFKVKNINNNLITMTNDNIIDTKIYEISYYPKTFIKLLNNKALYNYISTKHNLYDIVISKLYGNEKSVKYSNIFKYINNNIEKELVLKYFTDLNIENNEGYEYKNELYELTILNINNKKYNNLINKYSDTFKNKLEILKILFEYYTFPIQYNKRYLDDIFEKLLYFSFKNYTEIVKLMNGKIYLDTEIIKIIPIKLKTLYFNMLKIYYQMMKENSFESIIFNSKLYNDYIHYKVLKVIFNSDNKVKELIMEDAVKYKKIKEIFMNNIILIQLCKRLKWKNVSRKLNYLDELYNNKEYLFFQERLNKTIIPENFDTRLKKILYNPFEMFRYLRKKKDFIKWVKFLNVHILDLYNNSINVLEKDYPKLGTLIYLLLNVKEQNLKDDSYLLFINYCRENENLILFDTRINLQIREKFKFLKVPINLGFLAKHLTRNNESIIQLSKEVKSKEDNKIKEISHLQVQLDQVSKIASNYNKKYLKYKDKYLKLKTESSVESQSSFLKSSINNI